MTAPTALLVVALTAQAADHKSNPVYASLRSEGVNLGGVRISFPAPWLDDGAAEGAEREALRTIAGSDRAVAELTRDSVSAPFVLKTRDQPAGDRGTVRSADLFFVVRARLDDIDPSSADAAGAEVKEVEAGNMKFRGARVEDKDLSARGIKPADKEGGVREWYVHLTGRLLDRIHAAATDRITATKSSRSWLIAARTDARFDKDATLPNRWHAIKRRGDREEAGPDETYPGGASYVRIGTLQTVPGALLVEAHFAFFEPRPWFDGAPVLRSKIGVIAQDRVRSLRRDLAKSRRGQGLRKGSEPGRG
jgi:hypothetical protein